ncbi:MAG: hypothetical protein R3264_02025 [Anaerolineae bacterium]|nr:hypothetical protein [Anaerolineae bacterium]
MSMLEDAIAAIRSGDKETGRQLLEQILEEDENNEDVWLWLSSVVETDEDREICLENVLALNPNNIVAQKGLEALRSGTFNVHDGGGEALETDEDRPLELTFHDQFFAAADEPLAEADDVDEFDFASDDAAADNDIEWPGFMGAPPPAVKSQKTKAPATQTGSLMERVNIRIVILAVLALCACAGLGGFAAYNLFLGDSQISLPGNSQSTPDTLPVEEATPGPTPTPTETPFILPTQRATPEPTPTATTVVSPTPNNNSEAESEDETN